MKRRVRFSKQRESRRKSLMILLLFTLLITLSGVSFFYLSSKEEDLDQRSQAEEVQNSTEKLWNFSIIGDTQAKPDKYPFTITFPKIIAEKPDILFHVGDFSFKYVEEYPLKGMVDVQKWRKQAYGQDAYPVEIHVAPGNHDDYDNGSLKPDYVRGFCFGRHRKSDNTVLPEGSYPPFNTEIADVPGYCSLKPAGNNMQYSFERGNIRFIMLDMPFYEGNKQKKQWFKQQVCAQNEASATIVFIHECPINHLGDQLPKFIRSVESDCPDNNLRAVFSGHGHKFVHLHDPQTDVHFVETAGMFWVRTGESDLKNGFMRADVYEDRLEFWRYEWVSTEPDYKAPQKFLEISGTFEEYIHPSDPRANMITESVTLASGTNMVTFPLSADEGAGQIAELVEVQNGKLHFISYFEDGSWHPYKLSGSNYVGENFDIVENKGYLISLDKEISIDFEGYSVEETSEAVFKDGWNLVDVGDEYSTANEFLEELVTLQNYEVAIIYQLKGDHYEGLIKDNGVYGQNFDLETGKGYFVYVENTEVE